MSTHLKKPLFVALVVALFAAVFGTTSASYAQPDLPVGQPVVADYSLAVNDLGLYMIEYEGKTAVDVYSDAIGGGVNTRQATIATQEAITSLETIQAESITQMEALGAVELYSLQRVFNGTAIKLDDASQLEAIQALPNVKAIHALPIHELDNSTSVPFIGTGGVWDATLTGDGMTIGIIDTGIDYLHYGFDGSGNYGGQTDTTSTADVPFPTAKVVDGYDFVGDAYTGPEVPNPDPDPTDCNGHGSHVAGTAAGNGVYDNAGTPAAYTGPYDSTIFGTPPGDGWLIGPGVAPEASLVALKVFGCDGFTTVTNLAIEYSVDPNGDGDFSDHLDVINMSLGAGFGSTEDISTQATNAAAQAGVIVVASAGNSGDFYFITGSPGSAVRSISTAASVDDGVQALALTTGVGGPYTAFVSGWNELADFSSLTGDIEQPSGALTGCDPADFTGFTAGNIALVDRGACAFVDKANNAEAAGAVAMVVTNVTTNLPFSMGGAGATLPSVMISGDAGNEIKGNLPTTGTLDNGTLIPLGDTLASFSSRGPARFGPESGYLKPDIAAPGLNINSVQSGYDGSLGDFGGPGGDLTISGTSMAAPHMAGTMALLRQAYPDWTVEELKALAMNTATNDIELLPGFPLVGPGRIGAGRVDHGNAVNTGVIAYNAEIDGAVSLFEEIRPLSIDDAGTITKTVVVENKSNVDTTYNISVDTKVDRQGIVVTSADSSVTVPAFGVTTFDVEISYDPAAMEAGCDLSIDPPAGNRPCLSEDSGYVVLTPTDSTATLRVPFFVMGDAHSLKQAVTTTIPTDGLVSSGAFWVTTEGIDLEPLTTQVPLVSAFELVASSTNETATAGVSNNADYRYLGYATDDAVTGLDYFAISTWGEWSTPVEMNPGINLDLDQDGDAEFIITTCVSGGTHASCFVDLDDAFGAATPSDPTPTLSFGLEINGASSSVDTRVFRNDVMFLPVATSSLEFFWEGADPGNVSGSSAFDFWVASTSRDFSGTADCLPVNNPDCGGSDVFTGGYEAQAVDVFNPVLGRLPVWGETTDLTIPVGLTSISGGQSLLLLHHHNTPNDRAEVINLDPSISPDATTQLFDNPNFEDDVSCTGLPSGWDQGPLLAPGDEQVDLGGNCLWKFEGDEVGPRKIKQKFVLAAADSGDQLEYGAAYNNQSVATGDRFGFRIQIRYSTINVERYEFEPAITAGTNQFSTGVITMQGPAILVVDTTAFFQDASSVAYVDDMFLNWIDY